MKTTPKENRFEFVVIASARARQLLRGAEPRETGEKKVTIAQREVLRRKVVKLEEAFLNQLPTSNSQRPIRPKRDEPNWELGTRNWKLGIGS